MQLDADPKKVWTSQKPGEMSVCVILQLERISKITEVDICNEGSAFVEVLVNRSCSDDKKFQVRKLRLLSLCIYDVSFFSRYWLCRRL